MELFSIPEEHKRAIRLFLIPPVIGGIIGSLIIAIVINALGL